ncbi:MAG: alpha-amylase family glycosyl hydrolase [Geminicoccaceae bacterium]
MIETVRATYRIQLRGGVDFATIASAVPYIARLGISHLYLSPIWQARAGSTHGYDVVDPNVIEPALGGEAGFRDLVAEAKSAGLGIILDHVPNHMGVGSDNAWWWDVLLNGRASRFAGHFDIDWAATAGATPGRLLLPVLGASYGEVLASGDLRVEAAAGGFELRYHDQRFPLRADSVPNGQAELHALLERQAYRLAYWRLGGEALNYRRFFDIDGLVGVRVEDETVFADAHRLLLELVAEGAVQGVRLDHIDGLRDPTGYLHRLDTALREATGGAPPPVWVEKILEGGETLRPDWPVAGTTGYEAADRLARLFVAGDGMGTLDALWRRVAEGELTSPPCSGTARRWSSCQLRRRARMAGRLGPPPRGRRCPFSRYRPGQPDARPDRSNPGLPRLQDISRRRIAGCRRPTAAGGGALRGTPARRPRRRPALRPRRAHPG